MNPGCLICLRPVRPSERHHARCARRVFGQDIVPRLDLRLAELQTLALAMVGKGSLAGVQRKLSVGLHPDRRTLRVELEGGGRFILKPQAPEAGLPALPENEHLTMELARAAGLEVPDTALMELADGSLAYVVTRFDRPIGGGKRRQEDFCQLRLLPPSAKDDASILDAADVVRRFSAEPQADMVRLFQTVVFAFWSGNGDLHLKNLSLLADASGRHLLSPTYDQVSTALYPDLDPNLALPLFPGDPDDRRAAWERLGAAMGIPGRGVARLLEAPARVLADAEAMVARSHLPEALQKRYVATLRRRTAILTGAAGQVG